MVEEFKTWRCEKEYDFKVDYAFSLTHSDSLVHIVNEKGTTTVCGEQSAWGSSIKNNAVHECNWYNLNHGFPAENACRECLNKCKSRGLLTVEETEKEVTISPEQIIRRTKL